jgi:hypothetical protein
MFCNYCGSQNPEDALFCCRCGRKTQVGGSAPESSADAAPEESSINVETPWRAEACRAYGWLFLLAGIVSLFIGIATETGVTIYQGLLFGVTGIAIVEMSKFAVALVWTTTVLSGLGVIIRGIIPVDLLLWLVSLGLAIWYTN